MSTNGHLETVFSLNLCVNHKNWCHTMKLPQALNFEFIDDQYTRWKTEPSTLPDDWQFFFEGFELGIAGVAPSPAGDSRQCFKQARVEELIYRFRDLVICWPAWTL